MSTRRGGLADRPVTLLLVLIVGTILVVAWYMIPPAIDVEPFAGGEDVVELAFAGMVFLILALLALRGRGP